MVFSTESHPIIYGQRKDGAQLAYIHSQPVFIGQCSRSDHRGLFRVVTECPQRFDSSILAGRSIPASARRTFTIPKPGPRHGLLLLIIKNCKMLISTPQYYERLLLHMSNLHGTINGLVTTDRFLRACCNCSKLSHELCKTELRF